MSFRNNIEASPANPHVVTAAMLLTQASKVAQCVFDLVGIAPATRGQRLQTLYERMENFEIEPRQDKQVELIIRQSKAAIKAKLAEYTEVALQQAVHVRFTYDKHIPLLSTPGAEAVLERCIQDMVMSLMLASRHLGMLEVLKNIEGKHYSVRASAGGNTTNKKPSPKMTSQLLEAMIKGMIYNNPKLEKKDKTEVADELAVRIFKANREFEMLDIANFDDFKCQVRNILIESTHSGIRVNQRQASRAKLGYSLRHSFPNRNTEEARQMGVDAARTLGRIEGVKEALIRLIEQRFGELPSLAMETLNAADDLDQLQNYLSRLPEAQSLDDIIQKRP